MVSIHSKPRNAVFRAIADPTRREILSLLRGGQQTVGKIAGKFASIGRLGLNSPGRHSAPL
jgi:DNA-binding transcriptional ArsR family regulator